MGTVKRVWVQAGLAAVLSWWGWLVCGGGGRRQRWQARVLMADRVGNEYIYTLIMNNDQ